MHEDRHARLPLDGQHAALHLVDDDCVDAARLEVRSGDLGLAAILIGRHDHGLGVLFSVCHERERTHR